MILSAVILAAASAHAQITSVQGVDLVARLTGPGSINNTPLVGIGGTDLGHMIVHQDRTFLFFGDTFSGETSSQGGNWRWNTVAWTTDLTPADGLLFDGWVTDPGGLARQVIYSGYQNPITEIPTGTISVGNRIYTWFMSVNWWGPPGQWTINYAGLAYTEDMGQQFTVVSGFRLPSDTNFGMVAASFRTDVAPGTDEHVYVWGTPSGRLGGVKLARVLPANMTDPGQYEYFGGLSDGQPTWVSQESTAPLIVPATVGEMSVMYNRAARCWTMLYFNHNRNAIQLRQAAAPWGPWSKAMLVVSGLQDPGLYGSYMNPLYVENHGQNVYFTMSLWDPYDVYLMRARFTVASPPCPADLDLDRDVDSNDMALFLSCLSGPMSAYRDVLACAPADLDHDGDVDQTDLGLFHRCVSGVDVAAAPDCLD